MAQISLKQLEAFTQVAKLGSFRRASTVLNTTQPNISARISSLESQFGQILMERDAGSVRLTSIGEELLAKAQKVLSCVDELLVSAQNPNLFEGTLRLGVTETIAHSWLGEFLSAFNKKFPQVTIDLTVDLSSTLTHALDGGSIDMAFQSGPFKNDTALSIKLCQVDLCWVTSPNLNIGNVKLTKKEISKYVILTHSKNTLPYRQLKKHLSDESNSLRLVPSTSLATCLQMTVQGIGIACLPHAIIKTALGNGTLKKLNYHWVPEPLKFEARSNDSNAQYYIQEALKLAKTIVQ